MRTHCESPLRLLPKVVCVWCVFHCLSHSLCMCVRECKYVYFVCVHACMYIHAFVYLCVCMCGYVCTYMCATCVLCVYFECAMCVCALCCVCLPVWLCARARVYKCYLHMCSHVCVSKYLCACIVCVCVSLISPPKHMSVCASLHQCDKSFPALLRLLCGVSHHHCSG